MKSRSLPWGALLLCAAGALLPLRPARAAGSTFVVTNNSDAGDGSCTAAGVGDGCNLREAIASANAAASGATITFDPTAFASAKVITLSGTQLELSKNVLIKGSAAGVSVSGNNVSRVFQVDASVNARLEDLSITGGSSATAGGGGIYNSGTLTLVRSSVSNNTTADSTSGGGGIYNNSGTVILRSSTVAGNSAAAGGFGGGIYNSSGTLNADSSTISGNTASAGGAGGGILNAGPMNLTNVTIANNNAAGGGGGLYNNGATANLLFCTVTGNTANTDNAGGAGGGIVAGGTFNMSNTLVAGNTSPGDTTGPDFSGTVSSGDYNLLQDATGATLSGTHNLTGVDPLIQPLANNGGPVQTVALQSGSPAIDAGDPASTLFADARGRVRPVGAANDIGAYEFGSSAVVQPGPTFTVTNTTDVDGACAAGNCSLRQAVSAANNSFDPPTITFDASAFASAQTITLGGTELALSQAATLIGPGSAKLTVSGNNASRVFNLTADAAYNISGLTITKGNAAGNGGGLDAEGTSGDKHVFLSDVTFSSNTATGAGGGMFLYDGDTITNCTFSGNIAATQGGGLYVQYGTVNISKTTFAGNSTTTGGAGNGGGGIFASNLTLSVDSSTFSGNLAKGAGSGGGIYNQYSNVTVSNSTFSANKCPNGGFGGGIYNSSALNVSDSTLTLNAASIGGSGNGGGGIANDGNNLTLNNTIVGGNLASGGTGPDIKGTVNSGDYNLVKSTSGATLSGTHNVTGKDPKLGALSNNGGPTLTHLPLAGSPAIDVGLTESNVDQRGLARPVGAANDIGAVESGSTKTVQSGPSFVVTNSTDADGACAVGDCSLRQAIRAANHYTSAATISFDPSAFASPQSINLGGTELLVTGSVDIQGTGTAKLTVNGGGLSRVFNLSGTNSGTVVNISDLTITNGSTATYGGGLYNYYQDTTTLNRVVVTGNAVFSSGGGGIYNDQGALTLNACTVSNNTSANNGGGVYNYFYGTLTVNASTLSGNTATSGYGGGIYAAGNVTLNNTTVNGNAATNGDSGGVFVAGVVAINNCTITENAASNGYSGGGIYQANYLTLTNSIVANNTASASGADIEGTVQAGDYNLVRDITDATLSGTHNVTGQDPLLGALADNGGPTQTQLLLAGSPAANAGNPTFDATATPYDQRGVGHPRVIGGIVDIGAIESPAIPPAISGALISQYRLTGPGGNSDQFIELCNTTGGALNLTGWQVLGGASAPIAITGNIPARGHLLLTNSGGYSLGVAGDVTYTGDLPSDGGLTLQNAGGTVVDTVGASPIPPNATDQYAYVRRLESGAPSNTGNTTTDFNLVDTSATSSIGRDVAGVAQVGGSGPAQRIPARIGQQQVPPRRNDPAQRNGHAPRHYAPTAHVHRRARCIGQLDELVP